MGYISYFPDHFTLFHTMGLLFFSSEIFIGLYSANGYVIVSLLIPNSLENAMKAAYFTFIKAMRSLVVWKKGRRKHSTINTPYHTRQLNQMLKWDQVPVVGWK
jgi:flavorubredoxin